MTESKNLEQSNTDSTGIQSNIQEGQVYQAGTMNFYGNETLSNQNSDQESSPKTSGTLTNQKIKKSADVKLQGNIKDLTFEELIKLQNALGTLQEITGDVSLRFTKLEKGCINLGLEGSEESIEKIRELAESGKLSEILAKPVESIQTSKFISETTTINDPVKALLVEKISANEIIGANLEGANLEVANLREANLEGGKLQRANLTEAKLQRANLIGANLQRANLIGAKLQRANFKGAMLQKANLAGVELQETSLIGVELQEAQLTRANLTRANLTRANLTGANLTGANLVGANLTGADLIGANLTGADLREANLTGADLREANLQKAIVENAVFTDAQGISELGKADLKFRGAIFEDSPGDRSEVLDPVRR